MNRGAPTWFETVWRYGVEDIDFEEWILLLKIQTNCQNLGLEGKIS
jgi:hypothetical protein